tara:strand:+ start:4726 stop:5475 length:750 start_codon:yes stop_codon:yes gene_type:complete
MGHLKQLLVLALFCSATLAGCIGPSSDESMIDLVVDLETTSGTVVETYLDGELVSLDAVGISFDFSQTTSSLDLVKFGLDAMDGSEPMTIDASESSTLTHSFVEHGIHNVTLFAIDAAGTQNNQSASIRIDLRIEWSEQGTNEPMALPFNPTPNNGGTHPVMIEINSTVENPSLIQGISGGGQTVQFSWNIVDELDDTCQSKNGQAEDGNADTWSTVHFNTYLLHELRVVLEDGQDALNIQQTVLIVYE